MPKYCSVPNCKHDSGNDKRSFYKFPLQNPERLQQWLRNIGRGNWTPSRHQYICQEHFEASCFKVRWGIRYLESDAVPTLFQKAEKRKAAEPSEKKAKVPHTNNNQSMTLSDDTSASADAAETDGTLHTLHLYEITVKPSQQGETSLEESSGVKESDRFLQTDFNPLAPVGLFNTRGNFPLALIQSVDDQSDSGMNTEVVLMSECPDDMREELVNGFTAAILNQGHELLMDDCADVASLRVEDVTFTTGELSDDHEGRQVIAYFETVPNVCPSETSGRFTFSPETVMSFALSSKPITSTLPIVSKHVSPLPPPLVVTVERLDTEEDDGKPEEEGPERSDQQLEEHCYHRNSLSKVQLEAIVAELQKKVKVLQQRHRRHLEKLLGLETTVSQLRQNNLLNEERLQLLERAHIQTSAAVSDAGETVAIVYKADDAAYLSLNEEL